ncbi:MAG TPA: DUF4747 family protein [Gemmataceae bacterium]|nr:DUF4747 family protein [Gemmataceae bacterium]
MRETKFPVCAVNIAAQHHPKGIYGRLLNSAFELQRALPVHGDRHALLVSVESADELMSGRKVVRGTLSTFLDLDMDAPWFDMENLRVMTEDQRRAIQIPESLRPNMADFHFVLDTEDHILVCQARTEISGKRQHVVKLTGNMLAGFLGELFSTPEIQGQYGDVEVTPVPDHDSVEAILKGKIKRLHIFLRVPNPDDLEETQRQIKKRMKSLNAKQIEQIVSAESGEFVKPDKDLLNTARVAALNGKVDAVLKKGSKSVPTSTRSVPATFEISKDRRETDARAMDRAAEHAIHMIERFRMLANPLPTTRRKRRRR